MMTLMSDHPVLEHALKQIIKEDVFIFPLDDESDDCDYQVSLYPDPWGSPNQLVIEIQSHPEKLEVELSFWDGTDENGSPIRNEYWRNREDEMFKTMVQADDQLLEIFKTLSAHAIISSERIRFVVTMMTVEMDDEKYGEGFSEYVEHFGVPIRP